MYSSLFSSSGQSGLFGLGEAPPVIKFNTEPDTSADGRKIDWSCSDWIIWHQKLVEAFQNGWFASKIKYSQADAIKQANTVWRTWWDKANSWFGYNKSFCGYENLFHNYLMDAGLEDVLNITHKVYNPTTEAVVSVAKSTQTVTESALTTAENLAEGAENTAGTLKWLAPAILVAAIVGVGYWAIKTHIPAEKKSKA